jgi:hypothetical protein
VLASRLTAALVVAHAATASAQPVQSKEESDDLFGFGDKDAPAALDCSDGTAFGCVLATDPLEARTSPFALTSILTPARWRDLAVADAEHEQIMPFALGASRDDGGIFFSGATGLENRWLVEGAPTESVRTGGIETRVPVAFIESITVSAGGFAAADRAATGGVADVALIRGGAKHAVTAEVWASAATGRADLPPIPLRFSPVTGTTADPLAISLAVTATGPIARVAGARLWYAAGARPLLRDDALTRDTRRLVDLDADGRPDVDLDNIPITEPIDHRTFGELAFTIPMLARVGAERGPHAIALTGLITPYRDTRYFNAATESASGIRRTGLIVDAIGAWHGTWARTRARVIASWHRSHYHEDPRTGDANAVQRLTTFIPGVAELPDDPDLANACADGIATGDPYPLITNCPTGSFFAHGGAGLLFGETADRTALVADVAHQRGRHTLSAGVVAEDSRLITRRRYTGGMQIRSLFGGFTDTIRFAAITDGPGSEPCDDDPDETDRCVPIEHSSTRFRTRQLAAYLQDEWRPRADYAFSGGVRWESMELGNAFAFRDQIAPRVGFAWDPWGGGTSRVFAGFGRTFAMIPAGMGETVLPRPVTIRDLELNGTPDRVYDDGSPRVGIDPDLSPMLAEELVAGVQLAPRAALRWTLWSQARWLRRGLDDRLDPAAGTLALTNPIDPSATRRSMMVATELATDPGAKLSIRVQYQYARSAGASTGAFDPRDGATLYTGDAYDSAADGGNLWGGLPSDLRHRAAVEGIARIRIGSVPIVVGLRALVATGRPLDAYGLSGSGDVLLLPRGGAGRLGVVTTTNVHLAAALGHGIDVVADVFNLFDRQRATAVDELYTGDDVLPVIGGSPEDLVFLKADDDGTPVRRARGYGTPLARQPPLSAAIGVRARF